MAQLGSRDTRKRDTPPKTCQIYMYVRYIVVFFRVGRFFSVDGMSLYEEKVSVLSEFISRGENTSDRRKFGKTLSG